MDLKVISLLEIKFNFFNFLKIGSDSLITI
jgi:hypothetical protein